MFRLPTLFLALAATSLAAVPEGYRKVIIPTKVNTNFVVVPSTSTNGSMLVVQSKTGAAGQQWHLQSGNSTIIYAPDTTLCLDAGAQSEFYPAFTFSSMAIVSSHPHTNNFFQRATGNWKDMSRVYLVTCAPNSASQQWDVMADGRIALIAAKPQECLDLQYMRATPNNPVGLYSCAGLGGIGAADDGLNWPLVNATG